MKHVVEMASDGMIQTPDFIKISSDIQKFREGGGYTCKYTDTYTHKYRGDIIILLLFSK
jgi:hypothetical protein